MAELRDQASQYIGFEPNEIRLPITEEDRWLFSKIISDQEGIADIVMGDYRYLLQHSHNGKRGNRIHIGWLFACMMAQAKKVLINPSERQAKRDLSEKVLAHIQKRFE
ncbi:4361_t:CDS:1 [Funneliformis geosporum]|uniref:4361_t:CDS:1 n=1 Tax=Funneliformis geosporum TaxID=1117311 RepID=A0A9W4SWS1_9GLOM|nr:4361_t:CDS:1 [Funneliformis geosporum]